jgi:uncharacterized protein YkwD
MTPDAGDDDGGSPADAGDEEVDGGSAPPGTDVPDTPHCAPVQDWEPAWVAFEEEVLVLLNALRENTIDCGTTGVFPPAPSLAMEPHLRCAARLHSLDMHTRNFFDHVNPDGRTPSERVTQAGYSWSTTGENIAGGQSSPQVVMDGWTSSDGHCSNMMNASFEDIGIGYYPGGPYGTSWTQNFGATFD